MKRMTIDEVAKTAGVSKSTISRYLNGNFQKMSESTRIKIQKTVQELDYHPNRQAQMLKTKKSGLIGLVVADMANLYSAQLISGAGEVARAHNYQLLIMDSNNSVEQEQDSLQRLQDQALEGLIIQPMSRNSRDYQEQIGELPTVFVDRTTESKNWPFVGVDNYDATHHLGSLIAKRGYQQVLVVTEPIAVSQARCDRVRGIEQAAQETKMHVELLELAQVTAPKNRTLLKSKLEAFILHRRTAVFATNSRLLMLIMRVMGELQLRIPDDVGLSGFDDWHWTALTNPPLASIEQDTTQVGQEAVKTVLDQINQDGQEPHRKIITSAINVRGSI